MKFEIPATQAGFTLVEVLIVMAIIGILVAITVGALNPAFQLQKARDAKRKTDVSQIQAALEQYRADQGSYPLQTNPQMNTCGSGQSLTNGASTVYIQNMPCDPSGTSGSVYNSGVYNYVVSGSQYWLVACLENSNDSQGVTTPPSGAATGCTGKYYVVTNP